MTKHTPGPWHVLGAGIRAENGRWIAQVDAPAEANACLIAAAPEMLEAIHLLLKSRDNETCHFARVVMARAEGQT